MEAELTIQIVTWNSAKVLGPALKALRAIPKDQVVIRVIDNNSNDDSLALVRRDLPSAEIIELPRNRGFAGAHNRGLAVCETPLVMTHNPDLVLDWEGTQKLLAAFADKQLGAVQGMLLRGDDEGAPRVIDSVGVVRTLALNGRERGAGQVDRGQYGVAFDLLAVTGASGVYRLAALQDISYDDGEVFDNDFFAYKEDVDVGWRLTSHGWKVRYLPTLQGIHARVLGRHGFANWGLDPRVILQRLRSPRTRYSLRNWVWMILKNASVRDAVLFEVFADLRLIIFVCLSLLYWPLFSVWGEIIRGIPTMMRKREAMRMTRIGRG